MRAKLLAVCLPLILLVGIAAAQPNVWHVVNGVLTGPGFVTTGPVLASDGTAAAPSYSFASQPGLGLYRASTGQIAIGNDSVSGSIPIAFSDSLKLGSAVALSWSSATAATGAQDVSLSRGAANRLDLATADSFNLVGGGGSLQMAAKVVISSTAPTIASGFGTSPSIVASNGTAAFTVNVGTGGTASNGVITLPAATTGWICHVENLTGTLGNYANQRTVQIASTTTGITLENQTISTGAALAWTASDVLVVTCIAY